MASNKRRDTEFTRLMMKDFKVELINNSVHEFNVFFNGPADSLYSGGVWKVKVELPKDYPISSPSVAFMNKIYHPNVHFETGSVCLDVLNQAWSPVTEMVTVFEIYLPQLLMDPNFDDPLNEEAAKLGLTNTQAYEAKVKEVCQEYAKPEDVGVIPDEESDDEEVSEDDKDSGDDTPAAGSGDEPMDVNPADP